MFQTTNQFLSLPQFAFWSRIFDFSSLLQLYPADNTAVRLNFAAAGGPNYRPMSYALVYSRREWINFLCLNIFAAFLPK